MTTPVDQRLDMLEHQFEVRALEVRAAEAEARARHAELRTEIAQRFAAVDRRFDGVEMRLDTLIGAFAEFRAEYNGHQHGPTE